MPEYVYREDSGYDETFTAATVADATRLAEELLRTGDYGVITRTTRVAARIIPAGGENGWRVTFDHQPAEPPCADGEPGHNWSEGPAYGSNNGGVRWTSTCAACALRRITDTGDHDRATGAVMTTTGYESEP